MSKEIVMAGVRYNNIVYDGFNHGECFKKLPIDANMVDIEQGFITNDGEFVDRKKAFTIARKAHQLEYDYGIQKVLISEDIHINWLHKKDKTIADLEAKLAEKDEQINKLQTYNKSLNSIKEDVCKRLDLIRTSSKKDYIRNMEQQLAEKDEVIANYKTMYESVVQTCHNDANEIKKLKKQNNDYADSLTKVLNENADLVFKLTDKEKEIERLREVNLDIPIKQMQFHHNQDKISFAVEQLEKVKEKINDCPITDYDTNKHFVKMYQRDAIRQLDNQIKQLKEGM